MPALSGVTYTSQVADSWINDAIRQIEQQTVSFADQVSNYQDIATAYNNYTTNYAVNTVQNLANQVAQVSVPLTQTQANQVYQSSISRAGYNYQALDEYALNNIANQTTFPDEARLAQQELARRLGQQSSSNQSSVNMNVNVLQGLINTIPSLVSQVTNTVTNPILNTVNNLANQVANFAQVNNNNVNALIQSSFNRASQSNQELAGSFNRNIDELVNVITNTFDRSIDETNSNLDLILSRVSNQGSESLANTIGSIDRLANQVADFSGNLTRDLASAIDRDLEDVEGNLDLTFKRVDEKLPEWLQQIVDAFVAVAVEIGRILQEIFSPIIEYFNDRLNVINNTFEKLKKGEYTSADKFLDDMFGSGIGSDIVGFIFGAIGIIPMFLSMAQVSAAPATRALEQLQNTQYPNYLLSPDGYVRAYTNNSINQAEYDGYLSKLGLDRTQRKIFRQSQYHPIDLTMGIDWYLRDKTRYDEFWAWLDSQNISENDRKKLLEVLDVIPPLTDIITMAVREVFDPKKRALLGLDEGFPTEVTKWANKKGLSEQWAKNYWAMHWQPISPNQAYEMYHRGLINRDVLRQLIVIADYPPYMVDNLIEIAYNPLTRVDIRRMYKQGNMTYEGMINAHKAIGLSPDNARFLADFVVGSITDDDDKYEASVRTRVFSSIEKGYEDGNIGRQETINAFKTLQLSEQTATTIVNLIDYEKTVIQRKTETADFNKQAINLIKSSFKKGALPRKEAHDYLIIMGLSEDIVTKQLNILELERQIQLKSIAEDTAKTMYGQYKINQNEMYAMLDNLGFTPQEKYFIWYEADLLRKKRTKMLTEKQYEKLFKDGIITEQEYFDNLRGIGYTDNDATYLVYQDVIAFGA